MLIKNLAVLAAVVFPLVSVAIVVPAFAVDKVADDNRPFG